MATEEEMQARGEQAEAAMREAGVADSTPVQDDYFAFDVREQVLFPDGVSFVEIKALDEGARRKYMNSVNREVRLQKQTGDAVMQLASGDERKAILESAMCGWNLKRNGAAVPFSDGNVRDFLNKAAPAVVDLIEKAVRKQNPWIVGDVTVEDIDKQIEELNELRETKVREAEGNAT